MIVYNVKRRWFDKKTDAEKFRIAKGLAPDAIIKVAIGDRAELAALLDALCVPPKSLKASRPAHFPAPASVIDEAYVDPHVEVPDFIPKFLIKDMERRNRSTDRDDG